MSKKNLTEDTQNKDGKEESKKEKSKVVQENYEKHLKKLVDQYDLLTSLEKNFSDVKTLNVISIGCGSDPIEYKALQNVLNKDFHYTGVDIDETAIKNCQEKFSAKTTEFLQVNAADTEKLVKLVQNKKFHMVIFRHPELWGSEKISKASVEVSKQFHTMFYKTLPQLLLSGGVLLTSFCQYQDKAVGMDILKNITDSNVIHLTDPNKGCTDIHYATIFRPREETSGKNERTFRGGMYSVELYSECYFTAVTKFKFKTSLCSGSTLFSSKIPTIVTATQQVVAAEVSPRKNSA